MSQIAAAVALGLLVGIIAGIGAAFLWVALWTLAIPWEGHSVFIVPIFALAGFAVAALSMRSILPS